MDMKIMVQKDLMSSVTRKNLYKDFKSCPKSNKLPNLLTLLMSDGLNVKTEGTNRANKTDEERDNPSINNSYTYQQPSLSYFKLSHQFITD